MHEALMRQYLRAVKKEVRCSAKRKRAFLAELEGELREFAQETPDLAMEQLTEAFGSPQQRAQDFMETLDAKEIKKAFGWKKIVLIGIVAALLIWAIAVIAAFIDSHVDAHGYGVEAYEDDQTGSSIISVEEYT